MVVTTNTTGGFVEEPFEDEIRGADRIPPLQTAIEQINPERVKQILKKGADPDIKLYNEKIRAYVDKTPLILAAEKLPSYPLNDDEERKIQKSMLKIIKLLLQSRANPNVKFLDNYIPLHIALEKGDLEATCMLLNYEADPNIFAKDKMTPLHKLVSSRVTPNLEKMLKLLLENGANPNALNHISPDEYGEKRDTPLHLAAKRGLINVSKILLNYGADYKIQNDKMGTIVSILAIKNYYMLKTLHEEGYIDIHIMDGWGEIGLHDAAKNNNNKSLEYLLASGANPDSGYKTPETPLHQAIKNGSIEASKLLLEKYNADPYKQNEIGDTILHIAIKKGYTEIVEYLAQNYNKLVTSGFVDNDGNSPLNKAVSLKAQEMTKVLIDNGADPDIQNLNGDTALHIAVKKNSTASVELILKQAPNLDIVNNEHKAPLHLTTNTQIIELLLNNGADPNTGDAKGNTLLHLAIAKGYTEVDSKLIELGAKTELKGENGKTPLHLAVSNNHKEVINSLLENKIDPNIFDNYGNTPLMEAVKAGNLETVGNLLANNADPNSYYEYGNIPLNKSLTCSEPGIFEKLLEYGAIPDSIDKSGETPLHYTATWGLVDKADKLIRNGAELNKAASEELDGSTPLHYSVYEGDLGFTEFLTSMGADPLIRDIYGKTAIDIAGENDYPQIKQYLVGIVPVTIVSSDSEIDSDESVYSSSSDGEDSEELSPPDKKSQKISHHSEAEYEALGDNGGESY